MISWKILGVRVDFGLTFNDVLDIVGNQLLKDGKNHIICTTNPEFIIDAQEDSDFKNIINESDLSVPDGSGVIYAKNYLEKIQGMKRNFLFPVRAFVIGIWIGLSSFFTKKKIAAERISGVDLTYKLCELSSEKNYNVFLLGGKHKTKLGKFDNSSDRDMASETMDELIKMYPNLNIIGATSKYSYKQIDDKQTIQYIKNCMSKKGVDHIDFLFVAYNHINQEKWIVRNSYKIPVRVSIGCGGTFDYIVGNCKLPPEIYVRNNLGWLYRVFKQPWRVKRIIRAFPVFPLKIYIDSVKHRYY